MVPGAGRGEETTHKFSAAGRSEVVDRGFTVQGAADFVTEASIHPFRNSEYREQDILVLIIDVYNRRCYFHMFQSLV